MKKGFKKLGAVLLTVAMALAMNSTVFAAETLTDGKAGELYTSANEGAKVDNSVDIIKQIVIFNTTDGTSVHNPNITYTYTVASADPNGATVKDGDNDSATVYAGPTAALDASSDLEAVFSATDSTTAGTKGAVAEDTITLVFNPDSFGHAGIWRYSITEGDSSTARTGAGITRLGTDTVRYLDVYVRVDSNDDDSDGATDDFVIYGYVLSSANDSKNESSTANTDPDAGLTTKTNGFLADYNSTSGVVTTGDFYNTYNLQVVKDVAGTLGDKNEKFPFGISLSNATITAQPKVDIVNSHSGSYSNTLDTFSAAGALAIGDGTTSSNLKLKDGDSITIKGIPADITSTVTELNSSYDIYVADITTTAISGGTATHTTATLQPTDTTSVTAVTGTNTSTTNALTAGDLVLTLTNTIQVVSPTGFVVRFAPYALVLFGGIFLIVLGVVLYKRTNKEEA